MDRYTKGNCADSPLYTKNELPYKLSIELVSNCFSLTLLFGYHKHFTILSLLHKTRPGTTQLTQLLDKYGSLVGLENDTVIVAADNIGMLTIHNDELTMI